MQYASKFGKLSSGHRTGKGQFSFILKKGNTKECSNYRTISLISHTSKVLIKILQARLQQYVNCELSDVQTGFRKDRGTRDQIANICWIIEKARQFQKTSTICFNDYAKAFDCVDHNKLWKMLQEMGIPDHLTNLLRNLYAGKEEVDVFLELSCFYDYPMDVGNLISGSSAFSKSKLNIWKFLVNILLKPHLGNFEHYFVSI